ncbi:protein of unknown function DUF947, partial [Kipferlia bialata]
QSIIATEKAKVAEGKTPYYLNRTKVNKKLKEREMAELKGTRRLNKRKQKKAEKREQVDRRNMPKRGA